MNTYTERFGNFSSSEIWKLTKKGRGADVYFGAPALTYIEEKQIERRLGRPLSTDHNAKPTNWGKLVEPIAFEHLGIEHQLVSRKRYFHPTIEGWCGMPDTVTKDLAGDIKSPYTLKSFCQMADAMAKADPIEAIKALKPEHYWQLVSNAILTGKPRAGLYIYCPYQEDLQTIRDAADNFDGDQNKVAFAWFAGDDDLPYLIKGGAYYEDIHSLDFTVPEEDIEFITARVTAAVALLNN